MIPSPPRPHQVFLDGAMVAGYAWRCGWCGTEDGRHDRQDDASEALRQHVAECPAAPRADATEVATDATFALVRANLAALLLTPASQRRRLADALRSLADELEPEDGAMRPTP